MATLESTPSSGRFFNLKSLINIARNSLIISNFQRMKNIPNYIKEKARANFYSLKKLPKEDGSFVNIELFDRKGKYELLVTNGETASLDEQGPLIRLEFSTDKQGNFKIENNEVTVFFWDPTVGSTQYEVVYEVNEQNNNATIASISTAVYFQTSPNLKPHVSSFYKEENMEELMAKIKSKNIPLSFSINDLILTYLTGRVYKDKKKTKKTISASEVIKRPLLV